MIEIDLQLPLAHFTLAVRCTLEEKVTALVGPSGSGKTSLVEAVAGLRPRAAGRVAIDGDDVGDLPPERRRVGYVPQDVALFPHLNVRRNVMFGEARARGRARPHLRFAPPPAPASLPCARRRAGPARR